MNVRLSVREILFNIILNEKCPQKIIIIDAVDLGRTPGEVFEIDISEIPQLKIDDFSMHQLPTSNLLYELKNKKGIDIKIISTQVEHIPESVSPGLSRVVEESIPVACKEIFASLK
jgi:coenzyme F420 hydrogenase subunit delta